MKKIEAIIRPQTLDAVKKALSDVNIVGMTVIEVRGYGKQKGFVQHYRASETLINFLPKIMIIVVVCDGDMEKAVKTIIGASSTGQVGDGKIFISTIDETIRIRTGEKGEAAC